jgi:hypothetical protein
MMLLTEMNYSVQIVHGRKCPQYVQEHGLTRHVSHAISIIKN